MASFQRLLMLSVKNNNAVKFHNHIKTSAKNFSVKSPLRNTSGGSYITILNSAQDAPMMIDGYSMLGFRLNNGMFVMGPVALFPHSILSWDVENDQGINESSLSLFLHLYPKLDVLVIGMSDARNEKLLMETRANLHKMMSNFSRADRINVEVLPTEKAVTTFNFLNTEKRFVGAALLPPTYYCPTPDDEYRTSYLLKKRDENDLMIEQPG